MIGAPAVTISPYLTRTKTKDIIYIEHSGSRVFTNHRAPLDGVI
jgi:hypothetical protein